ncbi:MAG: hypothetical protein AAF490_31845 [Chloroflexota bacterium]
MRKRLAAAAFDGYAGIYKRLMIKVEPMGITAVFTTNLIERLPK